jgi:hypothetical protein
MYQAFALKRSKSNDLRSSSATLSSLFSRDTRIAAATMGQEAISALTDRPGINCRSVTAPTTQNGTEGAKTSAKNFAGDLY